MEVDLSRFDLNTGAVHPYLAVVPKGGMFYVYEGAFGTRYRYFRIRSDSKVGELCRLFWERYFVKNEYRHTYYEDGQELFAAAERAGGISKLSGLRAYYKYWNSFSKQQKRETRLVVIPHFKGLKEWYGLQCVEMLRKKRSEFVNRKVKEAYIRQWNRKLVEEMELYLQAPVPPVKFSVLSMGHAHELNKFYRWISRKRLATAPGSKNSTIRLVWNWIMNNPVSASFIGGTIGLIVGTWVAKILHILP